MVEKAGSLDKLNKIYFELTDHFVEREELAKLMILALLSKQHVYILGPPGTAKSAMVRALASHIDARYFEYLLTRFTTPEELLGPLDLKKLEKGEFARVTVLQLPDAEVAYLDEAFKANSAILNTLLSMINERKYHEGGKVVPVPLNTMAATSNELPEDLQDLAALYDRLLIRYMVEYIKDDNNFKKMLLSGEYVPRTKISMNELKSMQKHVVTVDISPILDTLAELRKNLRQEGITASDRRFQWSLGVIKAHAFLNSRNTATTDDLAVLQHIMWDEPEQIRTVRAVIMDVVDPFARKVMEYRDIIKDYENQLQGKLDPADAQEIMTKLKVIENEIRHLSKMALSSGKDTAELDEILDSIQRLKMGMLDSMF